jgi:hypothetical protein
MSDTVQQSAPGVAPEAAALVAASPSPVVARRRETPSAPSNPEAPSSLPPFVDGGAPTERPQDTDAEKRANSFTPQNVSDAAADARQNPPSTPHSRASRTAEPRDSGEIDLGDLSQFFQAASAQSDRVSGRRSDSRKSRKARLSRWSLLAIGGVAILVLAIILAILYGGSFNSSPRRDRDTASSGVFHQPKIPAENSGCNGVARKDLWPRLISDSWRA